MSAPKIFCFINGPQGPGDVVVDALSEDGHFLASHMSSSVDWAKRDIGFLPFFGETVGTRKHDLYKAHYPDGYELVWVDEAKSHAGVRQAYELHLKNEEVPDVQTQTA